METPPPLPDDDSPHPFKLPLVAWILCGIYAALAVLAFLSRGPSLAPDRIGALIASVLMPIALPVVLAWIVWRIARRSPLAGHIVFFGAFGWLALGSAIVYVRQGTPKPATDPVLADLNTSRAEQRAALDRGEVPDAPKANLAVKRASEQVGAIAAKSTGQDQQVALGAKDFMDQMLVAKQQYDDALNQLGADTFWKLSTYTTRQTALERRQKVQAFRSANAALARFQDAEGRGLADVLKAHGVAPAQIESAVKGFKSSGKLGLVMRVRRTDDQLAQAMLDFTDLAAANFGHWKINPTSGQVVLPNAAAVTTYNEILERVKKISAEQLAAQKEVQAPR